VRTQLIGAVRPDAILIPQSAVQQSANGHFVWLVDKSNKSKLRSVTVGEWNGAEWFINEGLASGDRVVVDGAIRLTPDTLVSITAADAPQDKASPSATSTK
jgi:membrane fusion protein (multidrug efflux system)